VLESAGGVNVAADAARMRETNIAAYGKERILARADEIDVYLAQRGRMNPVQVEDITGEPGFGVIRAVRENQVFLVDEELVSRPTPDLLDGIVQVRARLYPELFAGSTPKN
jgi:iron complex transport system substrate-binding protein